MMNDQDTLQGRVKRYAHVSSALGSAAIKFMGERFLGFDLDHETQARDLAKALGSLKGPVMKVAQILATIPDAVPSEYTQEFLHLQTDAPSMGWPFVKRRMAQELGVNWINHFQSFDREASFAASLGQVHKAVSKEGENVACKLQYPDMASVVEADLQQLKLIFRFYEMASPALKTEEIFQEISDRLKEELDYEREAKHIAAYQYILKDFEKVHLPTVIPELSTRKLLTMQWLEGKKLKAVLGESQELRNQLAQTMFHVWYTPFYHYGFIHGDPHLGNYTFQEGGSVNLLDFGCIRIFSAKIIQGVLNLYRALQQNDQDLLVHAYEGWGFSELSKETIEVLNLWAKLLYDPLLEDCVRPIQREFSGIQGRETAAKVHEELKKLGGIKPPREFVFLDRAAVGIGSVFLHLKAQLNWHQEFEKVIEGFELSKLSKNQETVLNSIKLSV
ncbi:putative protein kinase UbiB [Caedimonas varicaedens]|jgi:predicted unusual protein kinase regulating ubiquinone biosynthesis (AarF/ABC1/UbiB family)|uniref:ABC1 atypical kinase-like domain-containing protein n=1 Tax=Caedimonas varicaedens TaxID=1629334 RepID=A0A0K8MDL7_9PROT|nr:putative protein kinase UbiB [Caedimonas varicaedens]